MSEIMRRSLGIRHLACGSCNACEHEMNALASAQHDLTVEGWEIVASPRHADVVTITGPMTDAMREAARRTIDAVPKSRVLLAIGDCANGEGPWSGAACAGNGAGRELEAEIAVCGCPPTPEEIKAGLRAAAERLSASQRD